MDKRILLIAFLFIIVPCAYALPNDAGNVINFNYPQQTIVNYSNVNVSDAQTLQGYTPTTLPHSSLANLLWSVAGHIIDTTLQMGFNNIDEVCSVGSSTYGFFIDFCNGYGVYPDMYDGTYANMWSVTQGTLTDGISGNVLSLRDGTIGVYNFVTNTMSSSLNMGGNDINNGGIFNSVRYKIGTWGITGQGNETSISNEILHSNFNSNNMDDISPTNNDGTSGASVSYQNGIVGKAYFTDGGTGYGYYPDNAVYHNLYGTQDFAISFWTYFDGVYPPGWYQQAWLSQDCAKGYGGAKWIFGFQYTGGTFGQSYWHNGINNVVSPAYSIPLNSWHLITMSYQQSTHNYTFYFDGAIVGSVIDGNEGGNGVCTGNLQVHNAEGSGATLIGGMDDLRILSRAMTPSEVLAQFNGIGITDTGESVLSTGSGKFLENLTADKMFANNICYNNGSCETYSDTYWNDINIGGAILSRGSNAPTITNLNNSGIEVPCFAGSVKDDYASGCVEMPHDWKLGSNIEVHMHLTHDSTSTNPVVWNATIKVMNMSGGYRKNFKLTNVSNPPQQWQTYYADFDDVNMSGFGLGTQVCFRIDRLQSDSRDTNTGGSCVETFGLHYELDSPGSREEYVK